MKQLYKLICVFLCLMISGQVYAVDFTAQQAADVSSAVDPGLLLKQYNQRYQTGITSSAPLPKPTEQDAGIDTSLEKIKFKLMGVKVKGNTVFSNEKIEEIFKPYYRTEISVAALQRLVDQVTVLYRGSGYIISRAILPPQTIKNGVVEVQVIEGYISQLTIEGQPGWVEVVLNKYGEPVLRSRPLQIKTLERSLLLMNDLPGTSVKSILNPSRNIPGSSELILAAEQKKWAGYLSYDNYGTRYLGPQEIGGGLTVNSATFPGSSDSLRLLTVPNTEELQYIEFNHTNPVGNNGAKLTFDGNYIETRPEFILSEAEIIGRSQLYYLDLMYPWIRSRSQNFFIHGTANYQNVNSTILGQPFYADYFRTLVLGAEYNGMDRFRGVNDIKLDVEKGFDIMGAQQHFLQSRPNGVPNFFKINGELSRLQAFPWTVSFLGAFIGQYSCQTLLATEQFAYGGPIWGRGYNPSEIVGDDGVGMKFELRKDATYSMRWLQFIQYYLFYDAGIIWNRDGVNLPAKQSATSTGGGTRITFIPNLTGNVYYAKPLTHSVSTQVAMNKYAYKGSIFFQVIASF